MCRVCACVRSCVCACGGAAVQYCCSAHREADRKVHARCCAELRALAWRRLWECDGTWCVAVQAALLDEGNGDGDGDDDDGDGNGDGVRDGDVTAQRRSSLGGASRRSHGGFALHAMRDGSRPAPPSTLAVRVLMREPAFPSLRPDEVLQLSSWATFFAAHDVHARWLSELPPLPPSVRADGDRLFGPTPPPMVTRRSAAASAEAARHQLSQAARVALAELLTDALTTFYALEAVGYFGGHAHRASGGRAAPPPADSILDVGDADGGAGGGAGAVGDAGGAGADADGALRVHVVRAGVFELERRCHQQLAHHTHRQP
jgi:hypothetical protein